MRLCETLRVWLGSRMSNLDHEDPDLVTTAEAAQMLGVSVATVNRRADKGEIPVAAKAPGKRGARLFRREDVQALAKERAA